MRKCALGLKGDGKNEKSGEVLSQKQSGCNDNRDEPRFADASTVGDDFADALVLRA